MIPPNEVATLRALKNTAILLLLMFRLDKPTGETELSEILDLDPKTVRHRLRSLKRLGLVTRTHRYAGWALTTGGRQLLLGEVEDPSRIKTSGEISRSPTLAAASLSLKASNRKEQQLDEEAENRPGNSPAQNESQIRTSGKFSRSRFKRRCPKRKNRTVGGRPRSDPLVRANLETLQNLGLGTSGLVSMVCELDHVSPDYILGHKKRLEAEGRYSPGLLLKVVGDGDHLDQRYLPHSEPEPSPQPDEDYDPVENASHSLISDAERRGQEPHDDPEEDPFPQPDPSIFQPLSPSGMTAARAWEATRGQLQTDMPKATFDTWVRDARLIAWLDGTFVIAVTNAYARDWLESRLTSTIARLLTGICNRSVEVKFSSVIDLE